MVKFDSSEFVSWAVDDAMLPWLCYVAMATYMSTLQLSLNNGLTQILRDGKGCQVVFSLFSKINNYLAR